MICLLPARLPVSDTHDVRAEKLFFVLHFAQERLQRIARIHDAIRPGLLVDNRNMNKAPQMHERQNIVQRITLLAVGHNWSHYGHNSDVAENSMALGDLPYDVGFCNDTRHHALAVTNDKKRSMCAAQQLRCFCEQGVSLDRNQPFPGDRQYTRDTHWICPDWMLAVCTHRLIRRITRTRALLFIGDHTRLPVLSDNPDAPEPEGVLSEHIWQTNIIAT
jgi:hypothetical protein